MPVPRIEYTQYMDKCTHNPNDNTFELPASLFPKYDLEPDSVLKFGSRHAAHMYVYNYLDIGRYTQDEE